MPVTQRANMTRHERFSPRFPFYLALLNHNATNVNTKRNNEYVSLGTSPSSISISVTSTPISFTSHFTAHYTILNPPPRLNQSEVRLPFLQLQLLQIKSLLPSEVFPPFEKGTM